MLTRDPASLSLKAQNSRVLAAYAQILQGQRSCGSCSMFRHDLDSWAGCRTRLQLDSGWKGAQFIKYILIIANRLKRLHSSTLQ